MVFAQLIKFGSSFSTGCYWLFQENCGVNIDLARPTYCSFPTGTPYTYLTCHPTYFIASPRVRFIATLNQSPAHAWSAAAWAARAQRFEYQASSPDEVALVKFADSGARTHTHTHTHTHTGLGTLGIGHWAGLDSGRHWAGRDQSSMRIHDCSLWNSPVFLHCNNHKSNSSFVLLLSKKPGKPEFFNYLSHVLACCVLTACDH